MRKSRIKKVVIIASILACASGLILFIALSVFNNSSAQRFPDGTIVRKNVSIITDETEQENQPIEVNQNVLVFATNPKYSRGEIIVAGIIDAAPYGFIRKVVETAKDGERYIVKTEPGVLTDVFEEAHIVKTFFLSNEGIKEMAARTAENKAQNDIIATNLSYHPNSSAQFMSAYSADNSNYLFEKRFAHEVTNGISLDGNVGISAQLEVKIDITRITAKESSIDFGITLHNTIDGNIAVGYTATAASNLEKKLLQKSYVNSLLIGPVPVVITHEFMTDIEGDGKLQGTMGIGYKLNVDKSTGFLYRSATNKVEEINEKTFKSDGLKWSTEAKAEGNVSVGVYIHLISKLYNSTGVDLSLGVAATAGGAISTSPKQSADGLNYVGSLDMTIGPEIGGKIVVAVPVIDRVLTERPIFTIVFPPWWEKHWNSGEGWEKDIGNEYDETSEWYRTYGKLVKLELEPQTGRVYFRERMPGDIELKSDERGGVSEGFEMKDRKLVYSLVDMEADDVPELVIAAQSAESTSIWAVYAFANHVADSIYVYLPNYPYLENKDVIKNISVNDLDWKPLSEW